MQTINIGTLPNDTTGDPLRSAFTKINNNFAEQYSTVNVTTLDDSPGCVLLTIPIGTVSHALLQITSRSTTTTAFQSQMMSVVLTNDAGDVAFTTFGALNNGANVADIYPELVPGNLQISCQALSNTAITHTITYRVGK